MGILVRTLAALSTVYPEAKIVADPENGRLQIVRLIAKVPTIAAYSYRHSLGFPYVYPDNDLSYTQKLHEHALENGGAEVCTQTLQPV